VAEIPISKLDAARREIERERSIADLHNARGEKGGA
jgi:hypothetical protein